MIHENDHGMLMDEIVHDLFHLTIFLNEHLVLEDISQSPHLLTQNLSDNMSDLEIDELDETVVMLLDLKHMKLHLNDNHLLQ